MTQDKSHVSVGGLLGTTQLGLDFGKNFAFFAAEYEVDRAVE